MNLLRRQRVAMLSAGLSACILALAGCGGGSSPSPGGSGVPKTTPTPAATSPAAFVNCGDATYEEPVLLPTLVVPQSTFQRTPFSGPVTMTEALSSVHQFLLLTKATSPANQVRCSAKLAPVTQFKSYISDAPAGAQTWVVIAKGKFTTASGEASYETSFLSSAHPLILYGQFVFDTTLPKDLAAMAP